MYSAVFFGWPTTSISPSRCTSTPTCSIEVASTTSNGSASPARHLLAGVLAAAIRSCIAVGRVEVRVELQASWSRVRPMSADAMREVSSAMCRSP